MSLPAPCLVVYASLNQVHRVKRHLYRGGVYVDMVRAPQCLGVRGCSFALRCDAGMVHAIRHVSRELAIEIRGVFAESSNGYEAVP
jgi:hypothetical protein